MAESTPSELNQLRRENARLIGLLEAHGIAWRSSEPAPTEPAPIAQAAPACANEWRAGICEKPRISRRDCNHRELLPLSDAAI